MFIPIASKRTETAGPEIIFNCPACGKEGVVGKTSEMMEENSLLWIMPSMPFFTSRVRRIVCGQCGKAFRTSLSLEQLSDASPEDVARNVAAQVNFIAKCCIIMGLVLAIFPFFGLVFAGIGMLCTLKRRTGWRTVAIIGLVLSAITTAGIMVIIMLCN